MRRSLLSVGGSTPVLDLETVAFSSPSGTKPTTAFDVSNGGGSIVSVPRDGIWAYFAARNANSVIEREWKEVAGGLGDGVWQTSDLTAIANPPFGAHSWWIAEDRPAVIVPYVEGSGTTRISRFYVMTWDGSTFTPTTEFGLSGSYNFEGSSAGVGACFSFSAPGASGTRRVIVMARQYLSQAHVATAALNDSTYVNDGGTYFSSRQGASTSYQGSAYAWNYGRDGMGIPDGRTPYLYHFGNNTSAVNSLLWARFGFSQNNDAYNVTAPLGGSLLFTDLQTTLGISGLLMYTQTLSATYLDFEGASPNQILFSIKARDNSTPANSYYTLSFRVDEASLASNVNVSVHSPHILRDASNAIVYTPINSNIGIKNGATVVWWKGKPFHVEAVIAPTTFVVSLHVTDVSGAAPVYVGSVALPHPTPGSDYITLSLPNTSTTNPYLVGPHGLAVESPGLFRLGFL